MRIRLLLLSLSFLIGCASLSRYVVVADVSPVQAKEPLVELIASVVLPLGFSRGQAIESGGSSFQSFYIASSAERIDVVVRSPAYAIRIKDYNNFDETDRTRNIKQLINEAIYRRYRITLEYKRVSDLLS